MIQQNTWRNLLQFSMHYWNTSFSSKGQKQNCSRLRKSSSDFNCLRQDGLQLNPKSRLLRNGPHHRRSKTCVLFWEWPIFLEQFCPFTQRSPPHTQTHICTCTHIHTLIYLNVHMCSTIPQSSIGAAGGTSHKLQPMGINATISLNRATIQCVCVFVVVYVCACMCLSIFSVSLIVCTCLCES